MDQNIVRQLMYSVVQFLRSQLEGRPSLSDEGVESVEVALQCIETAYSISSDNTELAVSKSLYDIFLDGVGDQAKSGGFMHQDVGMTSQEASSEDRAEAEILKNEGNQLMREEKFSEALENYTKAISKDGSNAVYYCNRAAAHSKLNNHQDAIEDCKRALSIESTYSKAYGRMGLAYTSMNNHAKAKECYEMALRLDPDNESYKGNLAIAEKVLSTASNQTTTANPFANMGGLSAMAGLGSGGTPDLSGILSNPALMSMATQLMSDPNMQNMMTQMFATGGNPTPPPATAPAPAPAPSTSAPNSSSMEALLNAGRHLAEQMQNQHPELVEQLRSQMTRPGNNNNNSGQGDDNNPSSS